MTVISKNACTIMIHGFCSSNKYNVILNLKVTEL